MFPQNFEFLGFCGESGRLWVRVEELAQAVQDRQDAPRPARPVHSMPFHVRLLPVQAARFNKGIRRRDVAQYLARTQVDPVLHQTHLTRLQPCQAVAFGTIFPYQPVRMLAQSTLPRPVRIREVHRSAQLLGEPFVLRKFRPVIRGNRVYPPLVWLEQP